LYWVLKYHYDGCQISADESVLQLVTRPALAVLRDFVEEPSLFNESLLVGIPALYGLLNGGRNTSGSYLDDYLEICKWILKHGSLVLERLIVHSVPPLDFKEPYNPDEWRQVRFIF
jgi:hypothetical protein